MNFTQCGQRVSTLCGIFGAITPHGKTINLGIMAALAWSNRERGTDSLGYFDSSGKMTKRAGDPADVLCKPKVQQWLKNSQRDQWFLAGHTRFATRGKVNRKNSHPFRYGRIIGSHNGMVDAPSKFTVDSEYIFWSLNKHRGDYNKALGEVSGYWGLSWYDGEHFYLMNHSGELSIVEVEGVYYYSSAWKHLDSCTGGDGKTFKEGEVWKFDKTGLVATSIGDNPAIPPYKSNAEEYWSKRYGNYSSYSADTETNDWRSRSGGHTRNYKSGGRSNAGKKAAADWWQDHEVDGAIDENVREYDKEWQDAWSSYCSDESTGTPTSSHSMSDEEFTANENYAG